MPGHFHSGRIRPIIQIAARMIKDDPTLLDDIDAPEREYALKRLRDALKRAIPELSDKSRCANCGASMAEYEDILDINDALLLFSMAKIVKRSVDKGVPFTEANKIRVSSEDIHHTQKCRTNKCSKLGLIAKAGGAKWSITKRGWEALRGDPVPRMRVTFRGKIIERPEDTTTLRAVFYEHAQKMADKERNRKSLKNDQRAAASEYDATDWVHVNGMHQGDLL